MRVGVIYLASGVGGSVLSSLFVRDNISVGASGALFGLLGAMLSELFTNWTIYTNKVRPVPENRKLCNFVLKPTKANAPSSHSEFPDTDRRRRC